MMRAAKNDEARETALNLAINEKKDRDGVQVRCTLFSALRALEKAGAGGYRSYLSGLIQKGREGVYIEPGEAIAALELTRAEILRYTPGPESFAPATRENALEHYRKPIELLNNAIIELEKMEAGA